MRLDTCEEKEIDLRADVVDVDKLFDTDRGSIGVIVLVSDR